MMLLPLAWLFRGIICIRRLLYRSGLMTVHHVDVPVVVIGNVTVGGTGKTPLVVWLANLLRQSGYFPGIVSRGYRGKAQHWPQQVRPDSDPVMVGDEAILLARRCQCPVAVGPDRAAASEALLKFNQCDVIISDDGLQHYALGRDIEIVVIDGVRRFGNGYCLPAGPLREPVKRIDSADIVVVNGGSVWRREFSMSVVAKRVYNLKDEAQSRRLEDFRHQAVHAVAGIGNPARFFSLLQQQGIRYSEHAFSDHHDFNAQEIQFDDGIPVLMTEKDAVKCRRFADENCWYLAVEAQPDPRIGERVLALLGGLRQ